MTEWITILFKAFWCGWAALGFSILFNVPIRNLVGVWIGGAIVGLVKFGVLYFAPSTIVLASFFAALLAGIYSMIIAHVLHEPPMIFAIPSVIPLVPGVFAYRTMFGLVKLSGKTGEEFSQALTETVHNGTMTLFIITAFSLGVIIPNRIGNDLKRRIDQRASANE